MPSLYDQIGEEKLSQLVGAFYDIIETEDYAQDLHLLHLRGHGVNHSREEQIRFLSGFLGGPRLYVQKFGHSNLLKIHEHMEIGPRLRELWLTCMEQALDRVSLTPDARRKLMHHLTLAVGTIGRDIVNIRSSRF